MRSASEAGHASTKWAAPRRARRDVGPALSPVIGSIPPSGIRPDGPQSMQSAPSSGSVRGNESNYPGWRTASLERLPVTVAAVMGEVAVAIPLLVASHTLPP